jgi:hypothetical protein
VHSESARSRQLLRALFFYEATMLVRLAIT